MKILLLFTVLLSLKLNSCLCPDCPPDTNNRRIPDPSQRNSSVNGEHKPGHIVELAGTTTLDGVVMKNVSYYLDSDPQNIDTAYFDTSQIMVNNPARNTYMLSLIDQIKAFDFNPVTNTFRHNKNIDEAHIILSPNNITKAIIEKYFKDREVFDTIYFKNNVNTADGHNWVIRKDSVGLSSTPRHYQFKKYNNVDLNGINNHILHYLEIHQIFDTSDSTQNYFHEFVTDSIMIGTTKYNILYSPHRIK